MGRIYEARRWDGSGAMTYIPSFIRIVSDIQKLMGEYLDTQTALWSLKPNFIFSKWGKQANINVY
jgi:hypothetical protein